MELVLDFTSLYFANPLSFAWWFISHGGLILFLWPIWRGFTQIWLQNKQHEYKHSLTYHLLAIDVPKMTEQTPQAVEQIFASVAATYNKPKWHEKWFKGMSTPEFSFEIVSLGGYVQFLIRTEDEYRDLIEAAVYAQYPEAEITEVEDYVGRISPDFDTAEYDLWGTEFVLQKPWAYPIKTYPEFEHELSKLYKDTMASLLEILGRIKPDEDVWLQLVLIPTSDSWKARAAHEVQSIIKGHKVSNGFFDYIFFKLPIKILDDLGEIIFPLWGEIGEEENKENALKDLTPGQKKVVEAIEKKMAKVGMYTKFRLIYWGRRETFTKGRGVKGVMGAINQFMTLDRNGFKPSSKLTTKADYFLKQSRINKKQRKILRSYQQRDVHTGEGHGFILNIEELASLYHFPVVEVKAPLVKKSELKKAEPPFALPVYQPGFLRPLVEQVGETLINGQSVKGGAPFNLPFVE
ncbi:hypothetical protein KKC17_00035 [Patescibacteria group bacterium]|nr:hypothetical protein [Patescibacteria group bacterium]